MIEVDHVTFHYNEQGEQDVPPALRDVSLHIREGETVALIGHNGSGKSTLARLLNALLHPSSGTITVDGINTAADGEDLWTIRQRVGLVFQHPDDQIVANTVIDDVAFGPENLGLPRVEIEERVQEALALLNLEPYAEMNISDLSVGQKQRVAIAGVLAMHPRYLLLDEPTTMISGQTARHLLETTHRLSRKRGLGVVHITHFMREVIDFDRIIVMHQGQVLIQGTPTDIFARHAELQAAGLDVPLITQLGQRLRARGWQQLPEAVLSSAQLMDSPTAPLTDSSTSPSKGSSSAPLMESSTPQSKESSTTQSKESSTAPLRNNSRAATRVAPTMERAVVALPDAPLQSLWLFELRNVHHTYLRDTPFAAEALRDLSLTIAEQQTTALVGPSQAGKSTLVDLLAGLIRPAPGTFFFEGSDVASSSFDIERLRSRVGVVFQSPESQIFEETVGKDVSFGPMRKKVSLAESRRLVQESLEAVGLSYEDFRTRYTYTLSGGEKRRVAIAGVLAMQPRVIVFDEPTAGLDPRGRQELLALIRQLQQRQTTIVYISSSLEDAVTLADTIYILEQGQLTLSGTPREILARTQDIAHLDIELPEVTQIALELRNTFPDIPLDAHTLDELEAAIVQHTNSNQHTNITQQNSEIAPS